MVRPTRVRTESMAYKNYAPPVHNCHYIKSCHPPVKQYIMTHHNTEFIIYTCSLFFICNTKGQRPHCEMVCEYTGQSPPHDTSLEVSLPPLLPCSLAPSLHRLIPPTLASSPSFPRVVHALFRPFLADSLHQPSLPQPTLPPLTLSSCLASSLPPSPCCLALPPSVLPRSFTAPPACMSPAVQLDVHRVCVCVWRAAL